MATHHIAFARDEVVEIAGILNGTSNYILTRMTDDGAPFAEVLAEAQAKGYAEADPSLDIDGHDAAQKLLVLALLAFGARPPESGMLIEGIRGLDAVDVRLAGRFGYSVKHLAYGRDRGETVELRAHPVLVKRTSVLANVSGVLNAIRLEGKGSVLACCPVAAPATCPPRSAWSPTCSTWRGPSSPARRGS